jgi:hypothetical protein
MLHNRASLYHRHRFPAEIIAEGGLALLSISAELSHG